MQPQGLQLQQAADRMGKTRHTLNQRPQVETKPELQLKLGAIRKTKLADCVARRSAKIIRPAKRENAKVIVREKERFAYCLGLYSIYSGVHM